MSLFVTLITLVFVRCFLGILYRVRLTGLNKSSLRLSPDRACKGPKTVFLQKMRLFLIISLFCA